jgi:hypothetical protein
MKFLLLFIMWASLFAGVDRTLPYPSKVDADEIARQVYFVNHQFYLNNQILKSTKQHSLLIVKKPYGKKARVMRADRFLNNDYDDGVTRSKDLVVFNSSKLRGTGVLAHEFVDESKSLEIMMWLPALRKVRRMAEPSKNMGYSEADVAFLEEAKLRGLSDDVYELLGTQSKKFEFGQITLEASEMDRFTKDLPQEKKTLEAEAHILKATPKEDAWYDYRIDYIDAKHFTNYETKFYIEDKIVKIVSRQWRKVKNIDDERAYMWTYWHSVNTETKFETVNYVPEEIIETNSKDVKPSFWSERTLRKIKR